MTVSERLRFAPAPPTGMVVLRCMVYAAIAVWALSLQPRAIAETAALHWDPRSVLRLLPGPPPATVVVSAQLLLAATAAAAAIGWRGRIAQLAVLPPFVLLAGLVDASVGAVSHRTSLPVIFAVALAPAPLAAHWSLDRRRARRAGVADPPWSSPRWAWPVGLTQLVVVFVYLSSGVAKLRFGGLAWLQPESFQRWTYVKLDRMPEPSIVGLWIAESPTLALLTAVGILVIQLSVVGVLVWPRFRPVAVVGILAFHVASWVALDLQFLLMAAVAWVPLVDWEGLRRRYRPTVRADDAQPVSAVRTHPSASTS